MPLRSCKLQRIPREDGLKQPAIHVFAPSFTQTLKIRAYLNDFKEALVGLSVYPPDLIVQEAGVRLDEFLYRNFHPYFEEIAHLLNLGVHPNELESVSRHEFFVCTTPIPHWDNPNEIVPGLSILEQLLGYEYPKSGTSSTEIAARERDDDAHLLAALVLNFPNAGLELADRYDATFLSEVLKEATILSGGEEAQNSGIVAPSLPPLVKNEAFEEAKPAIANQLQDLGIVLPEDF